MAKTFNTASVRMLGAFLMFLGLMLVILRNTMMDLFVTVVAVLLLVVGFYLMVSGIRLLVTKPSKQKKSAASGALMLICGMLAVVAGVLALLYRGPVAKWILVAVGALVAVYGLIMLISLGVAHRSHKKVVLDMVLAVLTMTVGVLVTLLVIPAVAGAVKGLCFYLFGGLAIAVGAAELVLY